MKRIITVLLCLLRLSVFSQEMEWIPFEWGKDTIAGKCLDKTSMLIPVSVERLPEKFNMQFDLGSNITVFYGNAIQPFLKKYAQWRKKLDSTFIFEGQEDSIFRNVDLKLGATNIGRHVVGYYKGYGTHIPDDSLGTVTEKHIGTLGADLFHDKILIIDYPNEKICVTDHLPQQYAHIIFLPFKMKNGRIILSFSINGKKEDLLFDTGTSLFALTTSEKNAIPITGPVIEDSIEVSSWGRSFMEYGRKTKKEIMLGPKTFNPVLLYYDDKKILDDFYEKEQIWGIAGNGFFLDKVVVIDWKNQRFGVAE